jgi:uncharacterized membrane protein
MIAFYVMLAGILLARAAGYLGVPSLGDWHAATRVGMAVMFIFTGLAHFTRTRGDLVKMVPPQLPSPHHLVTLTGIAELAGAVGLLIPSTARLAAYGLMALLVALFPANIHAARTGHTIAGRPHTRFACVCRCRSCGSRSCGGRSIRSSPSWPDRSFTRRAVAVTMRRLVV